MPKIDIKKLFNGLQEQMLAELKTQEQITHPGSKGDATENNWLELFKGYLPKRYTVDKAFVIDHHGNVSDQIDLVIYDTQYSPLVFNQRGALYVMAESIYAVFEVKPELNKENVEYAGKKIESVRKLIRSSVPIVYSTGTMPAKPLHKIIGGLLTTRSGWESPIDEILTKHLLHLSTEQELDIVCCLNNSAFAVEYLTGSVKIKKNENDEVLIYTFLELLLQLQKIGTAPAIDLALYAKAIDSI